MRRILLLSLPLWAACAPAAPPATPPVPLTLAQMPSIDTGRVLADITRLASDEFAGRSPGSEGERLTLAYLADRFKAAGAEPGAADGTYIQKVPLVSVTPTNVSPLTVSGRASRRFAVKDEVVAFSPRVTNAASIAESEIVFAGYGVQAPELEWDDFRGLDVTGKTLIVLVNDPPIVDPANASALDPKMFGGQAMTYYGRWTYKYEKAGELGAAAVFIVHETGPAGYPFNVVQGFGDEGFGLVTADKNMSAPAIQGWLSIDAAKTLLKMAGQDFDALKASARTREFRPVALGLRASMSMTLVSKTIESANVVAKVTGSDPALAGEAVVYTSHWDHLGVGDPVDGDAIYNGARDNASGTALLLELARAFRHVTPAPKRTVVFVAVTAEESGLLGSESYARTPVIPLAKTLANINVDQLNVWGRTKDLTVIGFGASELDRYASDAAAEQGRVLRPDAEPEKGFYYRSDHFSFAKRGVPSFFAESGGEFIGQPASYGREKGQEWTTRDYHQPSDHVKPWWNLEGAAEDGKVFFAMGYRIANAAAFPEWAAGNEFRAIRQKALGR